MSNRKGNFSYNMWSSVQKLGSKNTVFKNKALLCELIQAECTPKNLKIQNIWANTI